MVGYEAAPRALYYDPAARGRQPGDAVMEYYANYYAQHGQCVRRPSAGDAVASAKLTPFRATVKSR